MSKKIIDLLSDKIKTYDEELKGVNKDIYEIKEIYDILKKNSVQKCASILLDDKKRMRQLYDVLTKYNKLSTKLLYKFNDLKRELIEKNDVRNSTYNISSINMNLDIMSRVRELNELSVSILTYNNNFIVNRYDALIKKKEEIKKEMKEYEYSKSTMKSGSRLSPQNIACINDLIYEMCDNEDQREYFDLLNDYIISKLPKEKEKEQITVQEEKTNITFVDKDDIKHEEIKEDKYKDLNNNYLLALKCFDNYEDVKTFLDSIKEKSDIKIIINKIIVSLQDDDILRVYLDRYLSTLDINKTEEETEELDNGTKENTILFVNFLENKNKILHDIEGISTEFYPDIYKGLNMIKEDGAINKRKSIIRRKKVFKLRVNKIRISYKRLSSNVYIILGVFRKVDQLGNYIIDTTIKRDKDLLLVEDSIVESIGIDKLWKEYVDQNNKMHCEIDSLIKPKQKTLV